MGYTIPLFDLNFDEAEERAVLEALRSKWISSGPRTAEFEGLFGTMLDVPHAIGLSNCTVALHLALKVLGIGPGDEVICPSLTFVATVNAVRYVGAVPVFCDVVGPHDLSMDPAEIRRLVTPKTKAIMVMHYGGFPADMDAIMKIAADHHLKVVEDACHGPLSDYRGRKLGTIGDIGCFSFFANKNISTGEGGMLVTRSSELAERARLLRSHGMTSMSYERSTGHSTSYDVVDLGFNYRLDDIRSAIGIEQLKKLPADLKRRTEIRAQYVELLGALPGVVIPYREHTGFVSNYIFPVVLLNSDHAVRERVRNSLHANGIQTSVHYPAAHRFSIYAGTRRLPNTEYVADNEITLPMHARLRPADIAFIATSLTSAVQGARS